MDMACNPQSSSSNTMVIALDCIEKLVSFHYFDNVVDLPNAATVAQRLRSNYDSQASGKAPSDSVDEQALMREAIAEAEQLKHSYFRGIADRLVGVVSRCLQGENTADNVQLQIVKALFALISSEKLPVRQSSMLATIKTAYNVFVFAKNPGNQTIAQGTLTQMVHLVLSRVPVEIDDGEDEGDSDADGRQNGSPSPNGVYSRRQVNDGAARDAFLLLRALCKMSMRPLPSDHMIDSKSPQFRARSLALNLIRLALAEHTAVFISSYVYLRSVSSANQSSSAQQQSNGDVAIESRAANGDFDGSDEFADIEGPDRAISAQIARTASKQMEQDHEDYIERNSDEKLDASSPPPHAASASPSTVAVPLIAVIRQYLSLALSRNLVSANSMILDLGLAVFELTMFHMRTYLRREMEVIFREILLPLLENKSSGSLYQRGRVLQTLILVLGQPSLVVELYLNYDCAEDSRVNVFQRLAEVLCKLGGNYVALPAKNSPHYWLSNANAENSADGAALVAAAWRAVQQRQTVFNTPLAQVLQSAGLLNTLDATALASGSGSAPPHSARSQVQTPTTPSAASHYLGVPSGLDVRRASRTYSMSSQGTIASGAPSMAISAMAYGGLNYSTSDRSSNAAALVDEYQVRQWALDALVTMLQSMVVWSDRLAGPGPSTVTLPSADMPSANGGNGDDGTDWRESALGTAPHEGGAPAPVATDDPEELSTIKQRKEQFETARKLFAWKPKKGVEAWKKGGFIKSNEPKDVARFFFTNTNQGIDKMQLGEYLGEGDAYNISVMHAFVDFMNFTDMEFVAALRLFLQAFRLPGEAQKIDRFMLKFAERYLIGNPSAGFANADAAYVLAYSTIMLNTDQHSPQVKNRMSKQEFINNNRGINDGQNLDPEFLTRVFDQIAADEIKLKDDPLEGKVGGGADAQGSNGPLFDLWGNSTANRIREQHAHASAAMAAKSEQSIRSMTKLRRKRGVRRPSISVVSNTLNNDPEDQAAADSPSKAASLATLDTWAMLLDMTDFLHATRADHIAPMFGTIWAAVLAALSSPMQTASDPHVIAACLVGFQSGIALACRFRMPLERAAFVTTLRNFTQLQNLAEMKRKHVEAIRALIEVAASRPDVGDGLAENWLDVLQCVSQLERLQLLTQGSEAAGPRKGGRTSTSTENTGSMFGFGGGLTSSTGMAGANGAQQSISARAFFGATTPTSAASSTASLGTQGSSVHVPSVSVAELAKLETNSQVLVVMVDRLFTSSVRLSGSGIVDFVRALSQVAWGEITSTFRLDATSNSSAQKQQGSRRDSRAQHQRHGRHGSVVTQAPPAAPSRLFSLTKIVEISYYNMERIRVEWSQIWAILGPLFDRVGAYSDTRAALFALDSLRQLSMKFLEKEELPHFAFQKEFLRPFADILEGFIPDTSPSAPQTATGGGGSGPSKSTPAAVVVDVLVKDMVLRCVRQLVQAAASHIRSGWKAVLNVAQIAARDVNDSIAEMGFFLAKECAELHGPQMWMLTTAQVQRNKDEKKSVDVVSVAGLEYFHELIDCLNEFAVGAAARRPRLALNAIDVLRMASATLGKQILAHPSFVQSEDILLDDQPLYRVWMPALRALHEVVMHTEDLEVRTRALDSFFNMAMSQGEHFSSGLWTSVLRDLVFTMFSDLRDPSASRRFATVDDLELWFSTTLIKALRHLISLFTKYYPKQLPSGMMAEVLELLTLCIAQPSEVLGKIGTSCLQDLVKNNYTKWDDEAWGLVCDTFVRLFNWSQPRELFSIAGASWESEEKVSKSISTTEPKANSEELPAVAPRISRKSSNQAYGASRPSPLRTGGSAASILSSTDGTEGSRSPSIAPLSAGDEQPMPMLNIQTNALPRANSAASESGNGESSAGYLHITLKCILQLLLIQTLGELFGTDTESGEHTDSSDNKANHNAGDLYDHMSAHHLFILLDCLDQSRSFAHRFNANRRVRRRLVEMGVMPSMPSLLKQETSSILTQLRILQRMNSDAIGITYTGNDKDAAVTSPRRQSVSKRITADRQAVVDEVDDRLSVLMRGILLQYCSGGEGRSDADDGNSNDSSGAGSGSGSGTKEYLDAQEKRAVVVASSKHTHDPSSPAARRSAAITESWRPCVVVLLRYLPDLAQSADAPESFNNAVSRLWPELVDLLGVAAGAHDLDIIGAVQRILAIAGTRFSIASDSYRIVMN
ncbi:guanine nucleotide exchange protein for ADP-robosylation factor [Dipsacomyces acuminosporus]|nr:guanine nucleotide exchange protein for ADP-robosylation factor [Dipsacomyces acuminosporus]